MAFALLVLGGGGCMVDDDIPSHQGGGSETMVSSLAGRVVDSAGKGIAGAAIHLHSQDVLTQSMLAIGRDEDNDAPVAFTKTDGSFVLTDLTPGSYFIECRGSDKTAALIKTNLPVDDTLLHLPDAVLQPTGTIRGRIQRAASDTVNHSYLSAIYVFLPGLGKLRVTDGNQDHRFVLNDVPAGVYDLNVRPAFPVDLAYWGAVSLTDLKVLPGDTLSLDSVGLPLRANIHSAEYTRDSLAVLSIFKTGSDSLESDPSLVGKHSAVKEGRIHMLFDVYGRDFQLTNRIQALDQLEYLNFRASGMDFSFTVENPLQTMAGIKVFKVNGYAFDSLPGWLDRFPSLVSLEIGSARMRKLSPLLFQFTQLQSLDLSGNALSALPAAMENLKRLRTLDLSTNGLDAFPKQLREMRSLRGVNLRWNQLCRLTPEEKAWGQKQDSLFWAQHDPLTGMADSLSWEETQHCDSAAP